MKFWLWAIGIFTVACLIALAIFLNWARLHLWVEPSKSVPMSFLPETAWTCGDLTVMDRKAATAAELNEFRPRAPSDVQDAKVMLVCPTGILTKAKLAEAGSVFNLTSCRCCDRATSKCE